jgi:hypothetical protein
MSNSTNGKFLRGIMLSSPVLVIAAVSIIFSVSVAVEGKIDSSPTGSTSNNTQQVDNNEPADNTPSGEPIIILVAAETLYSQFISPGEINPEQYYTNKTIKVRGKIADFVYGSAPNSCWISLKTDLDNGANIICYFGNYVIKPGADIEIGMEIAITGTCMGMTNGKITFVGSSTEDIEFIPYDQNIEA